MGAAFRAVSGRPGASFAPWATRPGRSRLRLGRYLTRRQASSQGEGAAVAPGWRLVKGRCRRRLPALARVAELVNLQAAFAARRAAFVVRSFTWSVCWWCRLPGLCVGRACRVSHVCRGKGGAKLNKCLGLNCLCNLSRRVQSESRLPGLRLPELLPDPGGGGCRGSRWRGGAVRPSVCFGGSKRGAGLRTGPRLSALRALCRFLGSGRLRVVLGLSLASWGNSGGFRGVEGLVVEWVDVGVRTACASFHVGELALGRLGAWCWRSGRTSRPGESPCLSGRLGSMA